MTDPLEHLDFAPVASELNPAASVQFENVTDLPMRCLNCGTPWDVAFLEEVKSVTVASNVCTVSCNSCRSWTGRASRRRGAEHCRWVVFTCPAEIYAVYHVRKAKSRHRGVHFQ